MMNMENKLARLLRNTGPARFFVPLGIIMIVAGILMLGFNTDNFAQTTGRVVSVEESVSAEGQQEYEVTFTYTVDGKEYEGVFPGLSGASRVGDDLQVYYDPDNPERITNTKMGGFVAPLLIALGALAAAFGVLQTVRAFRKSRELDRTAPGQGTAPAVDFEAFKTAPGVTEYYFRFDGNSLKPGYLIEDADRRLLFEGKMVQNALVGARTFAFSDHISGSVQEHEVGHTVTQTYGDEFFSASSWFSFDGENVWDVLHGRGLRLATDLRSSFPKIACNVSRNGEAFARIEASGKYVHEDEEAQHRLAIPVGRMYYRFWTSSNDFDTLFLTMFALSETEQGMVE